MLCSAPKAAGPVDRVAQTTCRTAYLDRELDLLPERPVLVLGKMARDRLWGRYDAWAYHPSLQGTSQELAEKDWKYYAAQLRRLLAQRRQRLAEGAAVPPEKNR